MPSPAPDNAAFLADAREQLARAPEPRAAGPGPEAEALRRAYLDLLKLSLCDLAGAATTSVGALADGSVQARELRGADRRMRAAGLDWPLHGLTMVGLTRLADLQACVEQLVAEGVEGDLIEAGAWRGGAALLMRATLDTLGDDRTVWVADSFAGFPADEPAPAGELALSAFDFLAAPLADVRDAFARHGLDRGVEFVPGFFAATLPPLARRRWALVRLDADTYNPTRLALECLYPGLAPGGHLVLDDYGSFAGCRRAVDEFRARHGITEPLVKVDATCSRWRREPGPPVVVEPPAPVASPAVERRPPDHVPTAREAELARENAELRARLRARGRLRRKLRRVLRA
jgi:O-methyltransferase